jgi:hypothetical protein
VGWQKATAKAKATANANANAGVLRFAQNDKQKQTLDSFGFCWGVGSNPCAGLDDLLDTRLPLLIVVDTAIPPIAWKIILKRNGGSDPNKGGNNETS